MLYLCLDIRASGIKYRIVTELLGNTGDGALRHNSFPFGKVM